MAQQQQNLRKFVLGSKELEGKNAEFKYDHGWYTITDINGEERNEIYKSRNAQEAYMKWNVYIGRKKERPIREERRPDNDSPRAEGRFGSRKNYRSDKRRDGDDHRTDNRRSADGDDYRRKERSYNRQAGADNQAHREDKRNRKNYNSKQKHKGRKTQQYNRARNKVTSYDWDSE